MEKNAKKLIKFVGANELWGKMQKIGGGDGKMNTFLLEFHRKLVVTVDVTEIAFADFVFLQNGKDLFGALSHPSGGEV